MRPIVKITFSEIKPPFKDPKKSNLTAFHHVSNTTGTRKWTFQDLSQDSQIMASALLRFDSSDSFTNSVNTNLQMFSTKMNVVIYINSASE